MEEEKATDLTVVDTAYLINELYMRGVTIQDIFGRYYELEIAGDGRSMYVEDANYAGLTTPLNIKDEAF